MLSGFFFFYIHIVKQQLSLYIFIYICIYISEFFLRISINTIRLGKCKSFSNVNVFCMMTDRNMIIIVKRLLEKKIKKLITAKVIKFVRDQRGRIFLDSNKV